MDKGQAGTLHGHISLVGEAVGGSHRRAMVCLADVSAPNFLALSAPNFEGGLEGGVKKHAHPRGPGVAVLGSSGRGRPGVAQGLLNVGGDGGVAACGAGG